jgi:hypothetical protein
MKKRFSKQCLWQLRNLIPIAALIADILELPHKIQDGYFRFLCPLCKGFDTATNPKTNLARCFACQTNFNTIDLIMIEKRLNFKQAVQYLLEIQKVDTKKITAKLARKMTADPNQAAQNHP